MISYYGERASNEAIATLKNYNHLRYNNMVLSNYWKYLEQGKLSYEAI
jgi:hypothetical protein